LAAASLPDGRTHRTGSRKTGVNKALFSGTPPLDASTGFGRAKMGKLAVFDEKFERLGRPDYSR